VTLDDSGTPAGRRSVGSAPDEPAANGSDNGSDDTAVVAPSVHDRDRSVSGRIFSYGLIALAVYGLVSALSWREEVRLSPLVSSAAFGLLGIYQVVRTEVAAKRKRLARAGVAAPRADQPPAAAEVVQPSPVVGPVSVTEDLRGEWQAVAWAIVVMGLVVCLGIVVGLPVAVLVVCRLIFKDNWYVAVGAVALTILTIWTFDSVFNVFWPDGVLLKALNIRSVP
jgi:ABC-type sugar transport system permease subunit